MEHRYQERQKEKLAQAKKAKPRPYPKKPWLPPQMDPPPRPRSPPKLADPKQHDHQGALSPSQPPHRPYFPSPLTQYAGAHQKTDKRAAEE